MHDSGFTRHTSAQLARSHKTLGSLLNFYFFFWSLALHTSPFLWPQSFQLKNKILQCLLVKPPKATHTFPRHGQNMRRKLTKLGSLDQKYRLTKDISAKLCQVRLSFFVTLEGVAMLVSPSKLAARISVQSLQIPKDKMTYNYSVRHAPSYVDLCCKFLHSI